MRVYAAIAILVIGLPLAGLGAVLWESRHFVAPGPATAETTVIVAPRESLRAVAQRLENAGVIDSATLFRIGVRFRGAATSLKAGEYAIPAHASQARIMAMLVAHAVMLHRITIAEGLTSAMAVAAIGADTVLTGPLVMPPAEGSLLPETYLFERGTTRQDLVRRMEKAQADLLAKLWPKRKAGLPLKSPEEAIILASMVEKETAIAAERPRIAAVFVNRLKLGMKLESDPTIIYGLTKGVPLGHRIRQSELAAANPYSTYQIAGLPPTPICNPGKDSIAAVLAPPATDELYFVADGSGGHVFARTLAEHEKNVAKWRQIEQAQAGGRHPGRLR